MEGMFKDIQKSLVLPWDDHTCSEPSGF